MKTKHYFLVSILFLGLAACANDEIVNKDLAKIPQNTLPFAQENNQKYFINSKSQQKLIVDYLAHYFSPWQKILSHDELQTILNSEQEQINIFSKHPGWGENKQRHNSNWMANIAQKMHLESYPNIKTKAIVTRNSELRMLPTQDPSFGDWHIAGEGYPFDNLQISMLNIGTPIYVLHLSRNGEWALVITPYKSTGWIKVLDIAYIDNKSIKKWMTNIYIAVTLDNQPIFDNQMHFYASSRIGQLFPLHSTTKGYYQIVIPIRESDGRANLKIVNISKSQADRWPLPISQKNIALLANKMLEQPYGWGELNGYRDCSSMMEALFTPFAIWLPRNSKDQALNVGKFIDLSGYNNEQKLNIIKHTAKPFLTLLSASGHIMLYIGIKDGQVYVFQSFWGVLTKDNWSGEITRAVTGRSMVTPLNFGDQYFNIYATFLDRVNGMTLL